MITGDGWHKYNIWEHSRTVRELYARRCRGQEEELTCHAQAAELLAPLVRPGEAVLDVGCGSGCFYLSLRKRNLPVEYFGIDATPALIEIGRRYLPSQGLPAERLRVMRIEDLDGTVDHVVCLNVLSNLDNYHRPLERMLRCAAHTVILRESCKEVGEYRYVKDRYLDPEADLKVHVNAYPIGEFMDFIRSYGFTVDLIEDRYTRGEPQMVIDHPHYWKFFVAHRA